MGEIWPHRYSVTVYYYCMKEKDLILFVCFPNDLLLWFLMEICHSTCRSSWSATRPGGTLSKSCHLGGAAKASAQGMFLGMCWL